MIFLVWYSTIQIHAACFLFYIKERGFKMSRCFLLILGIVLAMNTLIASPSSAKLDGSNSYANNFFAVVVGINKYKNDYSQLQYAEKDALGLYRVLSGPGRIPAGNIKLLLGRSADKTSILNAIVVWLKAKLDPLKKEETSVLFFFSGHGSQKTGQEKADADSLEDQTYLVTYNTKSATTGITPQELNLALRLLNTRRIAIFLDACHSGYAWSSMKSVQKPKVQSRKGIDGTQFYSAGSNVVVTSSRSDEVSWELDRLNHGGFTYALIQALRGSADYDGNGIVTLSEAETYLQNHVPRLVKEHKDQVQNPVRTGTLSGIFPLSFPVPIEKIILFLTSNPSEMNITISKNRQVFKKITKTPMEVELDPGTYTVYAEQNGYVKSNELGITLKKGQRVEQHIALFRKDSGQGILNLVAESSAEVFIDNGSVGKKSAGHHTFPLLAGVHRLELRTSSRRWSKVITIERDSSTFVQSPSLETPLPINLAPWSYTAMAVGGAGVTTGIILLAVSSVTTETVDRNRMTPIGIAVGVTGIALLTTGILMYVYNPAAKKGHSFSHVPPFHQKKSVEFAFFD